MWAEDETIGWIYQYYNDEGERKPDARSSPRLLAIAGNWRFETSFLHLGTSSSSWLTTPLGRTWYEAREGETALKDICRSCRRPSERFLKEGESGPASEMSDGNLNREDIFNRVVYLSHRPKKDPRDLKVLDPACGSGHFLLYSFDLLETIYVEAWSDEQRIPSELTNNSIREDFPDLQALRKAVPELIVRHNLHGIDIDLRACQIAALALWLRAQRTYQREHLRPEDRPAITRSNIVCAEPMPGERALLEQFVADLQPKVLGQLVQVVFEKMRLAGEAGTLLKIEGEISAAVAAAKRLWLAGPKPEQSRLFNDDIRPQQVPLDLDLSGITDEKFWRRQRVNLHRVARLCRSS